MSDPYYVTGLILPDLWKGFSRVYNKRLRDTTKSITVDFSHASLKLGIGRHIAIDRIFHSSAGFNQSVATITEIFRDLGPPDFKRRASFCAHVLYELLLDRFIILDDPALTPSFYKLLDRIDHDQLVHYLNITGYGAGADGFLSVFHDFRQERYAFKYADNSGMAYALEEIFGNVIKEHLHGSEKEQLIDVIDAADLAVRSNWHDVFDEIREVEIQWFERSVLTA